MVQPCYTRGDTRQSLIRDTIGEMFDNTLARVPDNDALIVCHQRIR